MFRLEVEKKVKVFKNFKKKDKTSKSVKNIFKDWFSKEVKKSTIEDEFDDNDAVFDEGTEMDEWLDDEIIVPKKPAKILIFMEKYSVLFFIIVAMVLDYAIEAISRFSFVESFTYIIGSLDVFVFNSFIIYVTLNLAYFFKRRLFATMVIGGIWLIGGLANGGVLSYRTTPFTGTDIKLVFNAMTLITKYMSIDQMILAGILGIIVVLLYVFTFFKGPKIQGKLKIRKYIICVTLLFLSLIPGVKFAVEYKVVSSYFGNIANAYMDYGFPYCFWCTVLAKGIDTPNNYSEKDIQQILQKDGADSFDIKKTPNIIIIQLESFFDPTHIKGVEYSEDPIPNFRQIKREFTSGYITVPVVGAGTANTEFEVLTGMNLRYFGPGEYPYKTIIRNNVCESVAYNLRDIGYSTHAIHNNEASFYGRKLVFANLGIETFSSEEILHLPEYTPLGWAKDATLKDAIMDCLKATEKKDFVYTITVQAHGGYPSEPILENPKIQVSGTDDEAWRNSLEYYVNQNYETDQFIGELVKALEEYPEDTVLVLFGDHLPSLGFEESDLDNGSLFETEYVMWDNMDLDITDQPLTTYQLSSFVMDKLDMHVGTLMKYHQRREDTDNYQTDLEILQYDMLYGKQYVYEGKLPYEKVALKMGVKDVTISSVEKDELGNIIIHGKNFNPFSQVKINSKDVEEVFIDQNTILVTEVTTTRGDIFQVNQVTAAGNTMRRGVLFTEAEGEGRRFDMLQ